MGTKCTIYEKLKTFGVVTIIVCVSVLNLHLPRTFAQSATAMSQVETEVDGEKKSLLAANSDSEVVLDAQPEMKSMPTATEKQTTGVAVEQPDTSPKTTTTSDTSSLVYVGVGLAAAAAIAVGLGSSGSSDDSTPEEPVVPKKKPVGASLDGDNWSGRLLLINGQRELVTAVVNQNGSSLEIITSSSQRYGRRFVGSIRSNAHIRVNDTTTGEIWTTFKGPANSRRIDIYDYVNNFQALDNLLLTR